MRTSRCNAVESARSTRGLTMGGNPKKPKMPNAAIATRVQVSVFCKRDRVSGVSSQRDTFSGATGENSMTQVRNGTRGAPPAVALEYQLAAAM